MRTYSARDVEDDINHVGWVPADVARGLYEALHQLRMAASPAIRRHVENALAAADGEEV